jgi:hypothetical protein
MTDAELKEHRECLWLITDQLRQLLEGGHPDRLLIKYAIAEAKRQMDRPGNPELLDRLYRKLTERNG